MDRRTTPRTPDYPDEITEEQLDRIERLVQAERPEGFVLTPLHAPGW